MLPHRGGQLPAVRRAGRRLRHVAQVFALIPAFACADDNWSGSIRAKVQADNRYSHDARVFGEVWAKGEYLNRDYDLTAAFDVVDRESSLPNDSTQRVYQAFLEKRLRDLNVGVKLGRFQRTDNLGFYYLDGGEVSYVPKSQPFSISAYAGRPGRVDHVRSISGDYLFGVDASARFDPRWQHAVLPFTFDTIELRGGYQRFQDRLAVDRLNLGLTATGRITLGDGYKYEALASGTYRADRNALENVWLSGQLDLTKQWRFRTSYEEYRPRNPFPTFRERFYTAYALGEQTLLRASAHFTPVEGYTAYLGGQRATREIGETGYGIYTGGKLTRLAGINLSGEFDYIEFGQDNAKSAYLSASHSPSATWRLAVNSAVRFENKQLYGENRAVGGEIEAQYMLQNNLILMTTGTYIWNTRIRNEYLGAFQVIYYFDQFKPKAM